MISNQTDTETDRSEYTQDDFALGDTVVDREQDDPDTAIVVNRPPMAAKDWEAYRVNGEVVTVAEDNPEYDPASNVVVVIFPEDLDDWGIEWDGDQPLPLGDAPQGIAYAFPPARLEPVGTYSPDDVTETPNESVEETDTTDDAETVNQQPQDSGPTDTVTAAKDHSEQDDSDSDSASQERLDAIAGIVTELNVDDVTVDTSEEAVVVEKLGEQYVIDTDGSVTADDLLAQRLETAIDEQLEE